MPANERTPRRNERPRARLPALWLAGAALLGATALGAFIVWGIARGTAQAGDSWRLIDARGNFSFRVPPDMEEVLVMGIDSYVGRYESAACRLDFDHGYYSDSLRTYGDRPEYAEEEAEVGGRTAKLVSFVQPEAADGFPFRAGISFADVGLPHRPPFGATRLTLFLRCRERPVLEVARPILRSVTFPAR